MYSAIRNKHNKPQNVALYMKDCVKLIFRHVNFSESDVILDTSRSKISFMQSGTRVRLDIYRRFETYKNNLHFHVNNMLHVMGYVYVQKSFTNFKKVIPYANTISCVVTTLMMENFCELMDVKRFKLVCEKTLSERFHFFIYERIGEKSYKERTIIEETLAINKKKETDKVKYIVIKDEEKCVVHEAPHKDVQERSEAQPSEAQPSDNPKEIVPKFYRQCCILPCDVKNCRALELLNIDKKNGMPLCQEPDKISVASIKLPQSSGSFNHFLRCDFVLTMLLMDD